METTQLLLIHLYTPMNRPKINKNTGFTLVELLVAIIIGTFISVMSTLIIVNGMSQIRAIKFDERIQSDTIHIHNTINYLVKQSVSMSITSDTLIIILPDLTQRTITATANELTIFDGVTTQTIDSDNVEVTGLFFEEIGRSVRVTLTLTAGTNSQRSLISKTVVTRRN